MHGQISLVKFVECNAQQQSLKHSYLIKFYKNRTSYSPD